MMSSFILLITSLITLSIGIMSFIFPEKTINLLFITVLSVVILRIVSNLIFWFNLRNSKKFFSNLFLGIFILFISYFVYRWRFNFTIFFQISFAFFFFLDFINRFIYFVLVRKENLFKCLYYLFSSFFSLLICIFIFIRSNITFYLVGFYLIAFGITYFRDFIMSISSYNINLGRPSIPALVALFLPYFKYKRIKILKDMEKDIKEDFEIKKPDIYISIHVGPKIYSRAGHIDICFEDEVLAFGQYDKDSLFFFKIFGDGVMYSLMNRLKYYDFVIDVDKKIVFEYGFSLTDKEKKIVRERINKLKENTVSWSSPYNYTYAHKLEKRLGAKLYKFNSGKLRKYYSARNNCVLLVDIIIKDILIDKINCGSFIIPGNYMYYFDNWCKIKNSKIVSKKIYF